MQIEKLRKMKENGVKLSQNIEGKEYEMKKER